MVKKKLNSFAKDSSLMKVSIKLGRERITFNLYDELKVDEDTVGNEIDEQPNSYAFLLMVRAKLNKLVKSLEANTRSIKSEIWEELNQTKNPYTGRNWTKDEVNYQMDASEELEEEIHKLDKRKYELEMVESCIRSFEQRSDLIRTISANLRSQRV